MGIFSRKQPVAEGPATATPRTSRKSHNKSSPYYSMATRPSFGQWLKYTWLDILTMVIMGVIGLGVYEAHPAPTRSFPVTFSDGEVVYPQFAYPLRAEIVPIWAAAMLGVLVPIFVVLCMQIRIRSFWDANNAIIGVLYSLITAAVFQVFLKWLIGGLRPHFLAVCQPDTSLIKNQYDSTGFKQIMFTRDICTGDPDTIDDSLESFPSGHTTAAFGGFVYLYLYLNAKLKVFSNYHPSMWKLVAIYAPILGAVLIGGALTIDEFHNWYDIVAGAIIGTMMAFSSYRMTYAAIWDWRFNHIPLNRSSALEFANPELANAVFTHRAGWGTGLAGGYGDKDGMYGGHHHNGIGNNGVSNGTHGVSRKPVNTGMGTGTSHAPENMV
ncbi:hypothetical protein N0V82_008407 [Gnomoniopsis sp. IMI 355080]|nr:hypothetical protein N0V82_008407 [Gnomoniopsis sp. IMI 355080]